ncbi:MULTISPECIES: aldo/keto reductase [unclassified Brevundimonas]|uniref:aldo/keto reductase n=2 Tax=Pseudomonadota TaxID=1224 RepID=UPI000E8D48A0|nr:MULTISPECIES: aldo/keto reductase [unclassified Brevundimonas]MCK6105586.1 aldo/keto reductase [Brevundimonas sp. EYE_349]HBI19702.1 alcohol dehydrogenase [Brevundimonas sp.]
MNNLAKRPLGGSGLDVAPLVFGGNVFGWTADKATSFALLDAFMGAGFDAIDTADAYSRWVPGHSGGESETIIGEWLHARGNREAVKIFTKVGSDMGQGRKDLSPAWIEKAVEDSLRRLQTDYIDLYQTHWPDPDTPQEETLRALDSLVQAGKVRVIGTSNHTAEQVAEALSISEREGLAAYASLQPHYNLYSRNTFEGALQDLAVQKGLGVITYFSLESGFLTGKYKTVDQIAGAKRESALQDKFDERGVRILAVLDAIAQKNEATPAQVALAWLLAQPGVTAPIVSATTLEQLSDTLKAATLALSDEDVAELTEASAS